VGTDESASKCDLTAIPHLVVEDSIDVEHSEVSTRNSSGFKVRKMDF